MEWQVARRSFLSDWSLAPPSDALQEVLERRAAPRSYERVVVCAEVQAALLAKHGRLCKEESGYSEDKELFDDQWRETFQLTLGMPCLVPGSGQLAAYLGEQEQEPAERCKEQEPGPRVRLRVIAPQEAAEAEQSCERRQVLPLPTAPASVGDWVLCVENERLLAKPGLCLEALPETLGKTHFLVAFPQQESNAQVPPEISCIDQRELVALPAKHSDWLTPVEETLKNCHEVRAALQDLQLPQAIIADEAEDEEEEEDSSESCTLEAEDEDESEGHSPGKMRTRQPERGRGHRRGGRGVHSFGR